MKKEKIRKKSLFLFITIIFFIILLIISCIKIISYLNDNYRNKKIQENIIQNSITVIKSDSKNKEQEVKYYVDFKSLKEQNSDIVSYLKVNGTNIDYIVVRGNDNNYYLKHNYEKKWNVSGWIFSDYRNKFDNTDINIVIFGHNTRDGSMFGTLKNVLSEEWQNNEDNLKIVLVTEKDTLYYQVFSTYCISPEEYYIKTEFKDTKEVGEFIDKVKARSNHDYNVEVKSNDRILTLSSCIGDGTKRVVLHAKLIRSEEN